MKSKIMVGSTASKGAARLVSRGLAGRWGKLVAQRPDYRNRDDRVLNNQPGVCCLAAPLPYNSAIRW
jgi:hypothetical protein